MARDAYPFKNLEQARKVREAAARVENWHPDTRSYVRSVMPQVARDHGHREDDWLTTVAALADDWETPAMAAERIARWVTLHAELHGLPPTQRSLQRTVEPTQINRSPE